MEFTDKMLDVIDEIVTTENLQLEKRKYKRVNHWCFGEQVVYPCKSWSPTRNPDCFFIIMDAIPASVQVFKFASVGNYKASIFEDIPGQGQAYIDAYGPTPSIALCLALMKGQGIELNELFKESK